MLVIRLIQLLPKDTTTPAQQPSAPALIRYDSKFSEPEQADAEDLVHCNIFSTSLSSAPAYTALSYTWGNPSIRKPIVINSKREYVTVNLEAALRHFQKDLTAPLTLWIDAICINQEDDAEKSRQVAHMRDIYCRAYEVLTWLGEGGSEMAWAWVKQVGLRAQALRIGQTPIMLLKNVLERCEAAGEQEVSEELGFARQLKRDLNPETNPQYAELVSALQDILTRPYWNRVWIVQEVTVATSIKFVCGMQIVDQPVLHHALRVLRNFRLWQLRQLGHDPEVVRTDSNRSVLQTNPSHAIELLKIRGASSGTTPMIYLLRRLQSFDATDARDRVFALLGIAKDVDELGLIPDYNKSCEQVYTELSRTLIRHGYFDVLSRCVPRPDGGGEMPRLCLQTWVRDWSRRMTCAPLQQRALDRRQKPALRTVLQPDFKASETRTQPERAKAETDTWDMPLRLSAIIVGKTCRVGDVWREEDIGAWLQGLQTLSHAAEYRKTDPLERAHTVWRTAVADQDIRQHHEKPRITEATLLRLDDVLSSTHFDSVGSQMLVSHGLAPYVEQMHAIAKGRRPFLTSAGYLAVSTEDTQVGDLVVILLGADVPYVIRRRIEGPGYMFIGEAYVHGCMDGEVAGPDSEIVEVELH